MKKEAVLLLIIAIFLLLGMILTLATGPGGSRHGYGALSGCPVGLVKIMK
jgi:hypothetical protein